MTGQRDILRGMLLALCVLVVGPSRADTPLPPPGRIVTQAATSTVVADPDLGTTVVTTPGLADWTVPGWYRFWSLSGDGAYFLAVQPGGNLIPAIDPDTVAFTVHYRDGRGPEPVRIADLPSPDAYPRTVSNWALYTLLSWDTDAGGWRIDLENGHRILLRPES